eukprot:1145766-Pelagomonas_calceolata.AAC.6
MDVGRVFSAYVVFLSKEKRDIGSKRCESPEATRLVEGMGSIDSPTHTQKDCVKGGLSTLKLFAHFTVLLLSGF